MKVLNSIHDFIFVNKNKKITVQGYLLSAYYRWCILNRPMSRIEMMMGVRGCESQEKETMEVYRRVKLLSIHVDRLTEHTPWESKCLVRALTLRKLMLQEKINCTIYLGVMKEDDGMVAHAWVRCGEMYPMGGNGKDFTMVAKFRSW